MALDAIIALLYWLSLKVALTFQCNFLTVQYFNQFQASRSNISKDLLLILSLGDPCEHLKNKHYTKKMKYIN